MAQLVSLGFASLVLTSALFIAGPERVHACSVSSCLPGTFFPAAGSVPANLKGICWFPSQEGDEDAGAGGTGRVRLARIDGAAPELIEVDLEPIAVELARRDGFLVVPQTPFVAGARYIAWDPGCHHGLSTTEVPLVPSDDGAFYLDNVTEDVEWSVARFEVVAAAALPSALGELVVAAQEEGRVSVAVSTGECTKGARAVYQDAELQLASSASAWADALFYETLIDDVRYDPDGGAFVDPFPGTAFAGRARERVYTLCSDSGGVEPGEHAMKLRAHIPGEALELPVLEAEIELTCPPGFNDTGADAAVEDDAGRSDAGARDGSVPPPSAGDGDGDGDSAGDESAPASGGGGCDCSATHASSGSSALWIACAVLWLTRRRIALAR